MTVTVSGGAFGIGVLTPCTKRTLASLAETMTCACISLDETALHNAAQIKTRQ